MSPKFPRWVTKAVTRAFTVRNLFSAAHTDNTSFQTVIPESVPLLVPCTHMEAPYGCKCFFFGDYLKCQAYQSSSRLRAKFSRAHIAQQGISHEPRLLGCYCHSKGGAAACAAIDQWAMNKAKVGATLSTDFFAGSPQQNAIMNRHLVDYYKTRLVASETTPYNIPASQHHILQRLGMEFPNPDAPECPHALHKCIIEGQMRRMRSYLPAHGYGVISTKVSKLSLLPPAGSVQHPVYEAKDPSRFPGVGIKDSNFAEYPVHYLDDVASVVTPHELVEKLSSQNPEGHLIVSGMNPVEVLDRQCSYEPASHSIEYDLGDFHYMFTGSENEGYTTPIDVTTAWLRTSSVTASNGRVYHVVLLEEKLGHCVWHIFCGDVTEQQTRIFPTGSYVRVPRVLTGTWSDQYLPMKLVSGILDFDNRAKDHSWSNIAAKVSQLAGSITPRTSAKERWVATYLARLHVAPDTWQYLLQRGFWHFMYFVTFQWYMIQPMPDTFELLDERKRNRIIHPTPGGGWSARAKHQQVTLSIPNNPTLLQRLSAFTGSVFTFLIPKILIGELVTGIFFHVDFASWLRSIYVWTDISLQRLGLTIAIVTVASIVPGNITKVFSRLAGHFWRQLWFPGWLFSLIPFIIQEITGAPGSRICTFLPGRGWCWQVWLWLIGLHTVLPGLIPGSVIPWTMFFTTAASPPTVVVFTAIAATLAFGILLENLAAYCANPNMQYPALGYSMWSPDWSADESFFEGLFHHVRWAINFVTVTYMGVANRGNCLRVPNLPSLPATGLTKVKRRNVDIQLPIVLVQPANIPAGPQGVPMAVSPQGLTYLEFCRAVEAAYTAQPNIYPGLTPGRSCFFDCVAHYYGTSHMWYSWYMAYFQKTPDPANPITGEVTIPEIQNFCAASMFGLLLSGDHNAVTAPARAEWPTLTLKIGGSLIAGSLHVEIAPPETSTAPIGDLARILATIRRDYLPWFNQMLASHNGAPRDSTVQATPQLLAFAGTHEMPRSYDDVGKAIVGSFIAVPLAPADQDGFAVNPNVLPPFDALIDYGPSINALPVAASPDASPYHDFKPATAFGRVAARFSQYGRKVVSALARGRYSALESHLAELKVGTQPSPPTRSQQSDNRTRNNETPRPARYLELRKELENAVKSYLGFTLPCVPLEAEELTYTVDVPRAARLAADLRSNPGELGTNAAPDVAKALDAIVDSYMFSGKTVSVPVTAYLGVSGSGKTVATTEFLRKLTPEERSSARVVCHTESLRAEAKEKLDFPEMRGFNFPTLANIILEPSSGIIIFDDAGQVWGGVLDLVLLTNPLVTHVVINGDPAQGHRSFQVAGTQSKHDPSAIATIAKHTTKYATLSHRLFQLVSNTLGIYTTSTEPGFITHSVGPKVGIPVCTASPRYVNVLDAAGRHAETYQTVQGQDYNMPCEVDATGLEGAILDRTAYVALTRSKVGVYLRMAAADPTSTIKAPPTGSDIMNALVYEMRASNVGSLLAPSSLVKATFYRHLHWSMPKLVWFANIGASVDACYFQNVIAATNDTFVSDTTANDSVPSYSRPTATPPDDSLVEEFQPWAKEHREVGTRFGQTDQFKDNSFVNPQVHKRNDTPTYHLSKETRLKSATRDQNIADMIANRRIDMCQEFDRLVPVPPKWSPESFDGYIDKAISEYLSKRTAVMVMQKLAQHDPDRTPSSIKISLKNQVIKKAEKMGKKEALPGQLIHEYDISQTLYDSSFALWLEDHLPDAFPSRFLFYRRMDPDKFIHEYSKRWRVDNGAYGSDVTRWDVGCDAAMVNFDVHVMRALCFPAWYIDAYIERRVSSFSQHGPMKTMQNSGDRYTWILNSIRRAVVTSIVCELTPDDTAAINGDDAAVDRYCYAKAFPNSPWAFKDENARRIEFSGFLLGGTTPTYSAHGLWYRTAILKSRDPSAQEKWESYLGLLKYTNLDSPYAMSVARDAKHHMPEDSFWHFLPQPLHSYFSSLDHGFSFQVSPTSLHSSLRQLFSSLPLHTTST
jgi:hypothetical protein